MELKSLQNSNLIALKVASRSPTEKANETNQNKLQSSVVSEIRIKGSTATAEYTNANSLINIGHIAADGVDEATSLLNSFISKLDSGDVEGVYQSLPEVGSALTEIADRETPEGLKPLSGIEFAVDENPPRTLRFPSDIREAFGLNRTPPPTEYDLSFLQKTLDAFKDQSKIVLTSIYQAATSADIAAQNLQASSADANDIDQALSLATTTQKAITSRPNEALSAPGNAITKTVRLIE